jgi:chaperonin GroES
MKTTLAPHYDKILIKPDERSDKTKSGIILPDQAKNDRKPRIGTVVAVGPGYLNTNTGQLIRLRIEKGERVLYGAYTGTEVEIDDEKLVLINENEVMGSIYQTE